MLETAPDEGLLRPGLSRDRLRFALVSKRIAIVLIAIVATLVTVVSIALANATSDRREQLRYAKETVELGNAQFTARRSDFRGSDCIPGRECKKPSPYNKFDWENDGCSVPVSSWKALFYPACQQHDFGYRNFGKGLLLGRDEGTRRWIDDRFRVEMKAICNYKFSDWLQYANLQACFKEADIMYAGVRLLNDWSDGPMLEPTKAEATQQPTVAPNLKPTLSNFLVAVVGPGHVGVSFTVGWQDGRDPVTCHFFIDGHEADARQCGTSSSQQFTGIPAGDHSFYATVTDKYGVSSDPSPTITKTVLGTNAPPPSARATSTSTPPPPKPTISNFQVVVYDNEPGHVGVAYDVGWQSGRDPVTCHFFIDGAEAFTAQCGTHSSKQFYGISPGPHSFYATVIDKYGVASNPSPAVVKTVPAPAPTSQPVIKKIMLSRGAAASSGYWYSVVLSGFTPGSSVTVSCHDSKDSQFWTQPFTIGSNGQASDSTLCYSGDGPDHWVTGGGVESNHVGW